MATRADEAPPVDQTRVTPKLFLAAGLEIGAAVAVAALVMRGTHRPDSPSHSHSGMAAMHPETIAAHWPVTTIAAGVFAAGALIWWLSTRSRAGAALAAAGLAVLAASPAVRTMSVTSHLVAMAALEVLAVAVPLLLIATVRRHTPADADRGTDPYTAAVITAAACYSGMLIVLHLPVIHDRAGHLALVPLWLALVVAAVGIGYWTSILATAGLVSNSVRRRALIIGQEVGAILGLAAIIRPDTTMVHSSPLGISAQLDQRLGGVLMLVTCAAVTLPLLKQLAPQRDTPVSVGESDGH